MIKRKQRIPMRDPSQLSGEDAETAPRHRVNGRVALPVDGGQSARIG